MNLQNKHQVLVLLLATSLITMLWTSGCAGIAEPLPPLSLTPNALTVSAQVGSATSQTVSLTNIGTADVSVSQAIINGTGFSVSGLATPMRLAVGQSKSFTVQFTASSVGSSNGSLTVVTDARHRPVILSLHGNGGSGKPGVASVAVSPVEVAPAPGGKVQFTATVQGSTSNDSVTWTTSMGTITTTGLYTAPSKDMMATVTATSVADPTKSASAVVLVGGSANPLPAPTPTPVPVSPSPEPTAPTVSSVSVSPATTSVTTGGRVTLTATVAGTTTNKAVTWSALLGTITSSGVYTAPAKAGTDTVTATSAADTAISGTATITVTAALTTPAPGPTVPTVTSVTVSPTTASSTTGGTLSFTATVQGSTTNKSVTWSALLGTITASGAYTAPAKAGTDTVMATSVADTTKSGSATVTVTAPSTPPPSNPPSPPTVTGVTISPTSPSTTTGGTLQFTASVQGTTTNTAVTWKAASGSITASGLYTAPSKAGTDTVTATSDADTSISTSTNVTVTAVPQQPSSSCGKSVSPTGGVDNTNWQNTISAAIQANTCVEVTAGTYNLQPFNLASGTNLQLDDGVTVSDTTGYSAYVPMFTVNASNITINAAGSAKSVVFTMPNSYATNIKDQADLQYNHCFLFEGSASNVTLSAFQVNQCGGDGFDLSGGSGITINGVTSSTNIRQGMSVTGTVSNVTVSNSAFNTNYASGIDIEPDGSNSLNNMSFDNDTTSGNPGGGISFGIYNLVSGATVSITVNNFQSTNDQQYCVFFVDGNYGNTGTGTIHFTGNTVLTGCGFGGAYGRYAASGPQITFDSLSVINSNRNGTDPHYDMDSAVGVELDGGQTGPAGNVIFNIQTISNNTGNMANYFQMSGAVNSSFTVLSGGSVSGATASTVSVYP
jgi:hypothetical protein